jgi:hypothetical protein
MSLRHQYLPPNQRWVLPLIHYMEDHLWTDSVLGGDIWNERWTRDVIHELLPASSTALISHRDTKTALTWLQQLTGILQKGQRQLYGIRRVELLSKEAREKYDAALSLRKKRVINRPRTLFDVWKIQYHRPPPPKRWQPIPLSPPPHHKHQHTKLTKWIQYTRHKLSSCNPQFRSLQASSNKHKNVRAKA